MKLAKCTIAMSLALLGAFGCGSDASTGDDGAGTDKATGSGAGSTVEIFPPKIFTGYLEGKTYQAPAIAHGGSGTAEWSVEDTKLLKVEATGDKVMLTALGDGVTNLVLKRSGQTIKAKVTIYKYNQMQFDAAEKRYMTDADMDNPKCAACHGKDKGDRRPNHTPTELDADTDEQIRKTFTTGVDPENRPINEDGDWDDVLNGKKHMWKVTDDEKAGMLSYLRQLEPNGYPVYDEPTTRNGAD